MRKRIAIYGSTGSIGKQALEVINTYQNLLEASVLTANNNYDLLIQQAKDCQPDTVVVANKEHYKYVQGELTTLPIKVFAGEDALHEVASMDIYDIMLSAIVGFGGMRSTLVATECGKQIALANKESLVVAGNLITKATQGNASLIIPVDSEHVAIAQCLEAGSLKEVKKVILTASGGAFRGKEKSFIEKAGFAEALKHPTWKMGAKVTIDSATLMNKGLEMIEAKWLFNLKAEQISAIVHPQSIIHSMVEFVDGQIMAQMGVPDMKIPIAYAFFYPYRQASSWSKFDPIQHNELSFQPIDEDKFPAVALAKKCLQGGGNMPCILNAANEVVVEAYLKNKVTFYEMSDIIAKILDKSPKLKNPSLSDYLECDAEARRFANHLSNHTNNQSR